MHMGTLGQSHGHRLGTLAHARQPVLHKHVHNHQRQGTRLVGAGQPCPTEFNAAIWPGLQRQPRPVGVGGIAPLALHRVTKPLALPGHATDARTPQHLAGLQGPVHRMPLVGQGHEVAHAFADAPPLVPHRPGCQQQHHTQAHKQQRQKIHAAACTESAPPSGPPCGRCMPNFFMW